MNLSHPFTDIMKTLMPEGINTPIGIQESFSSSPTEVIQNALESAIKDIDNDASVNQKGRNKAITKLLFDNGIFELKEATALVSECLGITRHAIYKYIREFKV